MTTQTTIFCRCGSSCNLLDQSGTSATMQCSACQRCALVIDRTASCRRIHLADFHLKRGNGLHQRPLDDVSMASRLVESLVQDTWPSPATIVDFGIDTDRHLGALQHAVHQGCAIYDLDRVMGDGPAITQLVRAYPHYPYGRIEFRTAYDGVADFY